MTVRDYGVATIVICIVVLICVFGDLNGDLGDRWTTESEASKAVHEHRHLNPYRDEKDLDFTDHLPYEELYDRQFEEFADPLGYENKENDEHGRRKKEKGHAELRRKRSGTGSDPFSAIAAISGGTVIHTDKSNLSSALGVLTSATLPSPVLITRWSVLVKSNWTGILHVDQSVYNLAIEVQTSCCKPVLKIYDPIGKMVTSIDPNVTVKVNTSKLYHIWISQPQTGSWTLEVEDVRNQTYKISVRGSSTVDFDASAVNVNGTPVSGQPEVGSNATYMKVEPDGGGLVSNWTFLVVKATNGTVLQYIPMGMPKGSRTLRWYIVQVVWPNMDVYISIQGLDKDGNMFTREKESMILPSGVRLILLNQETEYIGTCGTPTVLRYTVKNVGLPANFTSKVLIDTSNFGASVTPSTFHLDKFLSEDLNCTVSIQSKLYHDTVANVNMQIIASDGRTQYLQHNLITTDLDCRKIIVTSTPSSTPSSTASYLSSFHAAFTGLSLLMTTVNNLKYLIQNG